MSTANTRFRICSVGYLMLSSPTDYDAVGFGDCYVSINVFGIGSVLIGIDSRQIYQVPNSPVTEIATPPPSGNLAAITHAKNHAVSRSRCHRESLAGQMRSMRAARATQDQLRARYEREFVQIQIEKVESENVVKQELTGVKNKMAFVSVAARAWTAVDVSWPAWVWIAVALAFAE